MGRSDDTSPAFPIQLFEMGFDVWISCVRGTTDSLAHTTLDYSIDSDTYWDWTFADIGKVDLPAMTDFIITERPGTACHKITVLTHSTGVAQAMQHAVSDPLVNDKVDRIVALAPCYYINMSKFEF